MAHWDTQADDYITPEQWEAAQPAGDPTREMVAEMERKALARAKALLSDLARMVREGAEEHEILCAIEEADREVNPGDYFDGE